MLAGHERGPFRRWAEPLQAVGLRHLPLQCRLLLRTSRERSAQCERCVLLVRAASTPPLAKRCHQAQNPVMIAHHPTIKAHYSVTKVLKLHRRAAASHHPTIRVHQPDIKDLYPTIRAHHHAIIARYPVIKSHHFAILAHYAVVRA